LWLTHYKSKTYQYIIFLLGNQNSWQKRKNATDLPRIFEPFDAPLICHLATSSTPWLAVKGLQMLRQMTFYRFKGCGASPAKGRMNPPF
jgi:hypothetical protein